MEKKFNFKDKPAVTKVIYATVIAILCITAIVIGIVSAAKKAPDAELPAPDIGEGDNNENTPPEEEKKEQKLTFSLPIAGEITKNHSLSEPVFNLTLGEWRVHAGIDIAAEENASVMAAEGGVISGIYKDPMHGCTVEITHSEDVKTRYSNLDESSVKNIAVGSEVKKGDVIGTVGDSSVSELAEESHLHFEMLVKNVKVNPLDYINPTDNEG